MPAARPSQHPTEILFVLLLAGVSFALSQTLVVPALTATAGSSTPARRRPRGC